MYDLVVMGAGPAGLTSGIYAVRSGLSAIVLDNGVAGGQAATAPLIENYPGFESINRPGCEEAGGSRQYP